MHTFAIARAAYVLLEFLLEMRLGLWNQNWRTKPRKREGLVRSFPFLITCPCLCPLTLVAFWTDTPATSLPSIVQVLQGHSLLHLYNSSRHTYTRRWIGRPTKLRTRWLRYSSSSIVHYSIFFPLNVVDDPFDEVWQVNETSVNLSTTQVERSFFVQVKNTMVLFSLS